MSCSTLMMGIIFVNPSMRSQIDFSGNSPPVNMIPEMLGEDIDATEERHATMTSALSPGVMISVPWAILVRKFLSCIAAMVKLWTCRFN